MKTRSEILRETSKEVVELILVETLGHVLAMSVNFWFYGNWNGHLRMQWIRKSVQE